jgi:spermidine synthase
MDRNFYGSLRIYEYDRGDEDEAKALVHGTVDHGMQFTLPERRQEHITYYGPHSGVALALNAVRRSPVRVGVIGLGAGSLAAYSRPGDLFRFYEINPLVETFSRRDFTYLSGARGKVEVVLGDGRLSLEREKGGLFDVLVVDAFSGDAIPAHLLTREAVELYFRHLKPRGLLALHITNTHLNLEPVVAALARDLGKESCLISNESDHIRRIYRSDWAILSNRKIRDRTIEDAAEELPFRTDVPVWTDDYSNLFRILKRRGMRL